VKYPVYRARDLNRLADIVLNELKSWPIQQMADVFTMSGDEVIERNDLVPVFHEPIADM
jgi:hypothetical protein